MLIASSILVIIVLFYVVLPICLLPIYLLIEEVNEYNSQRKQGYRGMSFQSKRKATNRLA